MTDIDDRIRDMLSRGMTQKEVAHAIGITQSAVSQRVKKYEMERSERRVALYDTVTDGDGTLYRVTGLGEEIATLTKLDIAAEAGVVSPTRSRKAEKKGVPIGQLEKDYTLLQIPPVTVRQLSEIEKEDEMEEKKKPEKRPEKRPEKEPKLAAATPTLHTTTERRWLDDIGGILDMLSDKSSEPTILAAAELCKQILKDGIRQEFLE